MFKPHIVIYGSLCGIFSPNLQLCLKKNKQTFITTTPDLKWKRTLHELYIWKSIPKTIGIVHALICLCKLIHCGWKASSKNKSSMGWGHTRSNNTPPYLFETSDFDFGVQPSRHDHVQITKRLLCFSPSRWTSLRRHHKSPAKAWHVQAWDLWRLHKRIHCG